MSRSGRGAIRPRPRLARRLRALHRWLGLGAAVFLLLLCATGLALNHTRALGLDARFVGQDWLLDWYGISGPAIGPSYAVGERWVTLAEGRLYLDATEVDAAGIGAIVGAANVGEEIAVAAPGELILLNGEGEVTERSPVAQSLPGPIAAIAPASAFLWLRSEGQAFRYDPATALVAADANAGAAGAGVSWVEAGSLPAGIRAGIETAFRGRGLSLERVLTDLHSGRLFGLSGAVFNDLVAIALSLLALSGIWLFFRR